MALGSLPQELLEQIVLQLNVDEHLAAVGWTCKRLAELVFRDVGHAWRHVQAHYKRSSQQEISESKSSSPYHSCVSVWDAFELDEVWLWLPFNHTASIYALLAIRGELVYKLWARPRIQSQEFALRIVQFVVTQSQMMLLHTDRVHLWGRVIEWAAGLGHLNVIEFVETECGVKAVDCNVNVWGMAATNDQVEVIKHLMEQHSGDEVTEDMTSAFLKAASQGNADIVHLMAGAVGNVAALLLAALHGQWNVVQVLLAENNFDPSHNDNYALKKAAERGHTRVVELLLQTDGVDPTAGDNYALLWSVWNGHADVVKLLLAHPAVNPNMITEHDLIGRAVEKQYDDVLEVLIEDGRCNVTRDNSAAFRQAVEDGNVEGVVLLLRHADTDPNADNHFALKKASELGYIEIVERLLKDPRVKDSPSMNAAMNWF
ncbi:hypothetical protein HDU81_007323 [Chytriomyces hyalinus]|nr:hypothetical protein HDU81_007323 [Chytriomyces hyalinus]